MVGARAVRRVLGGEYVHPSRMLLHTGELLRNSDLVDPDTGDWGRDGVLASVSYDSDSESAQLVIDNDRQNFEALLARMAVVIGGR